MSAVKTPNCSERETHTTSKAEETAGTKVQGRKELVTFEELKVH